MDDVIRRWPILMDGDFVVVTREAIVNGPLWRLFPVINVDRIADIPCDYPGAMGVPITFIGKFNPEQFELIALTKHCFVGERETYRRLVVRNLHPRLPQSVDLARMLENVGVKTPGVDVVVICETGEHKEVRGNGAA